ncbi:Similar to Uroporphyrinogen-III synthase; acc. no. P87214 [Pyronema omphalodes CBS 100304]|uniref:Similar to Uroporphyrinogen-III synthase acc. no. P87214 n=1 Tax=Pyronema omphalodes (strain CBS 100304) TaxID=1076935 RepID=U4LL64_PYROM|nr:Similar to Uroporphyrinogen-III synthase; acc. no. P87214 [Pyronema omphalodes CBS 100304]
MSPLPIIFLKTKSSPTDPYDKYFAENPLEIAGTTYNAENIFVPVLQHQHINLSQLEKLVLGQNSEYHGMIITSQRAVEALGAVLDKHRETQEFLKITKVYVVGPATCTAVINLGFSASNVLGKECGNGKVLSQFILEDYNTCCESAATDRLPLLFLNNEKRGDIIPKSLSGVEEHRCVPLQELVVYETKVVNCFSEEFAKAMEATKGQERWVVVFSPTGADAAWDVLRDGINKEEDDSETFWASIGPTTEVHMIEKIGKRPDVVAARPSPEGTWNGIRDFMLKKIEQN